MKTSCRPFASPGTRFVALDEKTTKRPSAEIDGRSLRPFPPCPDGPALTLMVFPALVSRR